MTREGWMRSLAEHVDRMRSTYPDDEFAIVFDIDGTIVDARHLVMHVLLSYDRVHGTHHFHGITISDVVDHEAEVDEILSRFTLPDAVLGDVRTWYLEHVRDPEAVAASHRPYQGVLGVIRWFQLQAHTHVALHRKGGIDADAHARLAQRARCPPSGRVRSRAVVHEPLGRRG